jgi:hypothetical protein
MNSTSTTASRLPQSELQACLEACHACADACEHCATSCLAEPQVAHMQRCIRRDRDCADLCRLAAAALSRDSEFAASVLRLCADVCDACGEECALHEHDHCQRCAVACRRCADACRVMAQHLSVTGTLHPGVMPHGGAQRESSRH